MSMEIANDIREIIAKILHKDIKQVTDSDLENLDSMGRIALIVETENRFQVELMTENVDFTLFDTVAKMADFIKGKLDV